MSSFDSLLPAQQQVLTLLAVGTSIKDAAQAAGVHRNTVSNWTRSSPPFREALAAAQYEQALYWRDKLQSLAQLSITCLQQLLESPRTPPSILLRAAMAVLNVVSNPAPAPAAVAQLQRLASAAVPDLHNSAQPAEPEPASPEATSEEAPHQEPTPDAAIPAQPAQSCTTRPAPRPKPFRHAQPQPGRNDLCPCGSGEKYKRCCLEKTLAA